MKVNSLIRPAYCYVGANQTPVMIIDDFFEKPQMAIDAALNLDFQPDNQTSYPGIRAPLPKDYVVQTLKPLMQGLYKVFGIEKGRVPQPLDNYFSLITKPPESLAPLQTLPHFDNTNPNLIAVIHYLGEGQHGGIGFFKEKATGVTSVDASYKSTFYQNAQQYLKATECRSAYVGEDNEYFSCHQKIEYKPNRLIAFPGNLLHSSLVNVETDINDDPRSGRLTANMFVKFSEAVD